MCSKKRFDKIGAMLVIAKSSGPTQKSFKRKEIRYYYCEKCNAFHVTSKVKVLVIDKQGTPTGKPQ